MASFLFTLSVNFLLVFLSSCLAFLLAGRGFCRLRRILAAALILSALCTLLFCLGALRNDAAAIIAFFSALFCVLTAPYFLSRYLLRLPLLRSAFSGLLFILLILLWNFVSYALC